MKNQVSFTEDNLRVSLLDLSREAIHELFLLCRKAGIYAIDHPLVVSGVERPFLRLQRTFQYKKYFTLVLTQGKLYANNITIPDSIYVDYFKEGMQRLESESLLFEDRLTVNDLLQFVGRFVKRLSPTDPHYRMARFLEDRRVYSIQADSSLAQRLFETGLRYQGDIPDDFSIRRIVSNYFSGEIDLAVTILSERFTDAEKQAAATGVDFHPDLIRQILPEKFAQLPAADLIETARRIIDTGAGVDDQAADRLARLVRAFDYHPKRGELLDQIRGILIERGLGEAILKQSLLMAGSLKFEAVQNIDRIFDKIYSDEFSPDLYPAFADAFLRLLRTRQMGKAAGLVENITDRLAAENGTHRLHAITLLKDCIKIVTQGGENDFLDVVARHLQAVYTAHKETIEFAEVALSLARMLLSLRRFDAAAAFLNIIKAGRKIDNGVVVYESFVTKQIFEKLDDRELIARLVREIQQTGDQQVRFVRDILAAIHSDEVALQVAAIVSHPDRGIRQNCLKTLAELGRPARMVLSRLVEDDSNFSRPEGRHELPDEKWFLVRNAIFVLGNLRDPEACSTLRFRLTDPDIRVRKELVSALEKIGGDSAIDLLMILADDPDASIREDAIIALGLYRRHDLLPFFTDLLMRRRGEAGRIITAISQTGSVDARDFLTRLLENDEQLRSLSSGKASVKDLRAMIITALAKIGDETTQQKVQEFLDARGGKTSTVTEKSLTKTAKLFLEKIQPKK